MARCMTSQVSKYSINRSLKQLGAARRNFLRGSLVFSVVLGLLPGGRSLALHADGAQMSTKTGCLTQNGTIGGRLAFLHIPKTGGTSIEDVAQEQKVCWGSHALNGDTLMPDGNVCSKWHVPLNMLKNLVPDAALVYAHKKRFCVTRDPAERAVSEYTYLLEHPWGLDYERKEHTGLSKFPGCTKEGLNNFVQTTMKLFNDGNRYIDDCHHLPQVDYIWDDNGKQMCDFIIRSENLTDSFNDLMERFGGGDIRLTQDTDTHSSSSWCPNISVQDLSEDTMALLTEVYADDYRLLNYSLPS